MVREDEQTVKFRGQHITNIPGWLHIQVQVMLDAA